MIRFNQVNKVFQTNKETSHVLKNVNLHIKRHKVVGIVGYSGAGKSTLIRLINALIEPTSGDVIVDGHHLNQMNKKQIHHMRHSVAMIFQSFNLLSSLTVYENIALALKIAGVDKSEHKKRVLEVIDLVGLEDKVNDYPKTLSGGQKQRVGIARAIVNHPSVLLCDEITSALDQKTAYEILEVLKQVQTKTGVTICFISHQMDMIRKICDRVIVMHQGEIVEENDTKGLFINPKHKVTQTLIASILENNIQKHESIYRLIYTAGRVDQSILSDVIKKYNIDTNIIHAKSIELKYETLGYLWIQIKGPNKNHAINALLESGIEVYYE